MPFIYFGRNVFAVPRELHGRRRPVRYAQIQGKLPALHMDFRLVRHGKVALDGKAHIAMLHLHRKVLFEVIVPLVCVHGAVAELGEALHAASRTAPKLIIRTREHLEKAARHGLKIRRHARFRVLR